MSLPAAPAIGAMSGALTLTNPLDILLASVNSNPYFIGLMMLLLNLGGRFLSLEVSKEQEKFLSHPFIRRFFLFVVLFVATRNIIIATGLTILVIICLGYLFNENSELCLWKSCIPDKSDKPAQVQENFVGLTPEEAMIYKRLQDKKNSAAKPPSDTHTQEPPKESLASVLYNSALTQLNTSH